MKRLFAVLAAILMAGWAFADDEVMLWMMEDPTVTLVGGGEMKVSQMTDVTAARVAVINRNNPNGGDTVYLRFYDGTNGSWTDLGDNGVGVYGGFVDPIYVGLGEYGTSVYSFMVELGNWSNGNWMTFAVGTPTSYDNLVQDRHLQPMTGDGMVIPSIAWDGGGYSVPEPSSALLLLIGGALFALRRGGKTA